MCVCESVCKILAQPIIITPFGVAFLTTKSFLPQILLRTRLLFCELAPRFPFPSRPLWLSILSRYLLCETSREVGPWSPARTVSRRFWGQVKTWPLLVLLLNFLLTCTIHTEMYLYCTHMAHEIQTQQTLITTTQRTFQKPIVPLSTYHLPKGNHYPDCFLFLSFI